MKHNLDELRAEKYESSKETEPEEWKIQTELQGVN